MSTDVRRALEKRVVSSAVAQRLFGSGDPRPMLGGYELVRRLGAGGMGVVFEALDPRTGQRLALKVLHERGFESLERLKREFRVLLHLHHENLVELHELSVDSEQPFLTMELVDGVSVNDYVWSAGVLDAERMRAVLRQLVDAVSTLHAAGVVHCDLTPSNLLVREDGRLVVLDFGLARALEAQKGSLPRAGTPLFMAPERLQGMPASEASDWFSVGVIVSEVLGLPIGRELQPHEECSAPSDLIELCMSLRALEPEARPSGCTLRARFGLATQAASRGLYAASTGSTLFVGRDAELQQLRAAFARACCGQPAIVYVCGEPGIGKTSLAKQLSHELKSRSEAFVLAGACYERELLPYNAFDGVIEALAQELGGLSPEQRQALRPAGASELCQLFPSLSPYFEHEERGVISDRQRMRRAAFVALRELLVRLSALRPLVLQLDDLQWGDADSAQLLSDLFEPVPSARWLIIACYRGAAERLACIAALQRAQPAGSDGTLSLELGPLTESASLALARALSSQPREDAELSRLSREAAGNPLFLRALVLHQRDRLADTTLSNVLIAMLEQLSPAGRRLLELAALAAEPLEQRILLHAARLEMDQTPWPEHLASLQHMGLLRRTPLGERQSLEPYHFRVSEAATAAMTQQAKQQAHRLLASAAEALNPEGHEFLAVHHEGAGELEAAARHAERAADRALQSVALERAASLYTQALRCSTERRPELVRKLADATAYAGRCADAVPMYLNAATAASQLEALALRLQASEMLLRCGRAQEGREVLEPIVRAVGLRYPSSTMEALVAAYASLAWAKLTPLADAKPRREPTAIEGLRTDVCFSLGLRWGLVEPPRTCALLARNYLLAREASTDAQLARATTGYALVLAMLVPDSTRMQDRALDRAKELALASNDREAMGAVLYVRSITRFLRSECRGALDWIDEARRWIEAECMDSGWLLQELDTAACCQYASLGRMLDVDRILERSYAAVRKSGNVFQSALMDAHRGFAFLAHDDPSAAIEHSEEVIRRWIDHDSYQVAATGVWAQLFAFLYAGDSRAALRVVEEHWPIFDARGYSRAQPFKCSLMLWASTAHLARVRDTGDARHLAYVERSIARVRTHRIALSEGAWRVLAAGVAHARGEHARALALYAAAAERFEALGFINFLTGSLVRQAELTPDRDRAARLRAQADAHFREHGVVDAERYIAMYTPIRSALGRPTSRR